MFRPRSNACTTLLQIGAALSLMLIAAACGSPTQPTNVSFQIIELRAGTGAEATAGKVVDVHYTGWLYRTGATDNKGSQFDSSAGRAPFQFTLGSSMVIQGWNQGIAGMKVGGMRRLIIPAELGYGAAGRGPIPPNAPLVFDVELVSVQ